MRESLGASGRSHVTVWWEEEPRRDVELAAAAALPNETGGILLGHASSDSVLITHAIGPGPDAQHHPTEFTPDRDWQYGEIDRLFRQAKGNIEYLGDWHTHPLGIALPSKLDLELLRSIAASPESQCPRPVMCILASTPENVWTERFFIWDPAEATPYAGLQPARVC